LTNHTNIFVYKNSIEPELCERLIKLYKDHKDTPLLLKENYGDSNNVRCNYIQTRFFPDIDNELVKVIYKILLKAKQDNPYLNSGEDTGYALREIYGETRLHIDSVTDPQNPTKGRTISIIIALNSDYEGGEFNFPLQNYKVKLKQGDAIVFPATYTHPHEVSSPENGTLRYTINTWMVA
tara:strand:- start:45 stop:584 length:540 start_codon:yes stop_codon:yes gene_type:complete